LFLRRYGKRIERSHVPREIETLFVRLKFGHILFYFDCVCISIIYYFMHSFCADEIDSFSNKNLFMCPFSVLYSLYFLLLILLWLTWLRGSTSMVCFLKLSIHPTKQHTTHSSNVSNRNAIININVMI